MLLKYYHPRLYHLLSSWTLSIMVIYPRNLPLFCSLLRYKKKQTKYAQIKVNKIIQSRFLIFQKLVETIREYSLRKDHIIMLELILGIWKRKKYHLRVEAYINYKNNCIFKIKSYAIRWLIKKDYFLSKSLIPYIKQT